MNERYRSKYLVIDRDTKTEGRRVGTTCVWVVLSTGSGALLGQIRWFSRWRQYVFSPHVDAVFNPDCLREIADFVAEKTREGARR